MNTRARNLLIAFGLFLFVIGAGAIQDWFGENPYGADGIAYFDEANALCRGDWTTALNPYWSLGYPLALASVRWMFPADWAGEWTSIHVVNLVIFAVTYGIFLYFLQQAQLFARNPKFSEQRPTESGLIYVVGSLIFLEWQVQIKNVSRTTPDLMVCALFLLLTAVSLQFYRRPTAMGAVLMGLVAGLGYLAKAAFLPLSVFVFLAVLLRISRSGPGAWVTLKKFLWFAPAMALVALPYVCAISAVLGRFTLGESGALNYAWTVNQLPHWHWVGGPPSFGEPIHPVRLLATSPHVYEFGEPIHVTYPPFYNPFYWYEGYRHFFSFHNQMAVIKPNFFALTVIFFDTPHAPVKFVLGLAVWILVASVFAQGSVYWKRLLAFWPVYLPSLLAIAMYLAICLEPRYIVGPVIVLMIAPWLAVFLPSPLVGQRAGSALLLLVALLSLTYLIKDERHVVGRAWRNESFTNDEDWRIGLYLTANGPPPGTKVAMVRYERGIQTTWAYVSKLHIIGQIGNQDFKDEQQDQDFQLFLTRPDVQQTVFELFRQSGAVLVVALGVPGSPQGDGWHQVPGTKAWLHEL